MLSYRVGPRLCRHSLTVNALHSCRRTLRGNARCPHFSLAIISVTVQLWLQVFWVISLQFNIRNTVPKFGLFLLSHPAYINSINIPPIMIIIGLYELQNLLSLQLVSFLVRPRTYQHPCIFRLRTKDFSVRAFCIVYLVYSLTLYSNSFLQFYPSKLTT